MTRVMRARLVILALAVAAPASAATVRFDSLAPGTVLTDQLRAQGVVFQPFEGVTFGVIERDSGGRVASFRYAHSMEFPPWGARAVLTVAHRELKVRVAVAPKWGPTAMTLTAYDRFGRTVAEKQATVTSAGAELAVTAPEIVAFTLAAPYGNNTGPPLVREIELDDAPLPTADAALAERVNVNSASDLVRPTAAAVDLASSATASTAAASASASVEWMLWALGALLLIALAYFLWRSR